MRREASHLFDKPCTIELLVVFPTEQVQAMKDKLKSKQYAENELAWLTHLFVSSQYLHDFLPVHYSLNRLVEGDAEPTLTTSGLCYMYVLELIKNLRGDESRLKYARRAPMHLRPATTTGCKPLTFSSG